MVEVWGVMVWMSKVKYPGELYRSNVNSGNSARTPGVASLLDAGKFWDRWGVPGQLWMRT